MQCNAEFTFINTGSSELDGADWVLYFNQATIVPKTMKDSMLGKVEHINGDFYHFVPGKSFKIEPGDSLKFEYVYDGAMIKYGDVPTGLYLVLNENTEQSKIVEIKNYSVAAFSDLSKVLPDSSYYTTPASEYYKNLYITKLEPEKIGKIIPTPFQTKAGKGKVMLNDFSVVLYAKGLENEAGFLAESIKKLFGIKLCVIEGITTTENAIVLRIAPAAATDVSDEAYHLAATKSDGIQITGTDAAGVFYGVQSLLSLMWVDKSTSGLAVNCVDIQDVPRFGYRGFLLDVSRNFQKKEDILRLIDLLSMYKINKLNIRITEDEGWRIEIAGLPELTEVGSRRGHTRDSKNWLAPSFGSGPNPDSENNYGTGFYTREQFKEILKYANEHHIQVIPEVCFPSHARAAIKAMEARYDKYMALGDKAKADEFRLIDPDDKSVYHSAQMYNDNIVCVALPSAYHFYETVFKDFIAMYEEAGLKMTIFNTGGDEVANGAWAKSPLCIELTKSHPEISNPRELHGYFIEKTLGMLEKYNLKITGWEEFVLNKDSADNISINRNFVGKNVMPLVWDNTDENIDLGYRIANAGYPVVLCNVTNLYFDLAYNTDPSEPGLYWGGFQDAMDPFVMTPFDVYKSANYDMLGRFTEKEEKYAGKERLKPECRKNIVGLQAQLWSETLKGSKMMEYYMVPKLFAFAEKAWAKSPAWETEPDISKRVAATRAGWSELSNLIGQCELPRIDQFFGSYNYRIAPPGAIIEDGLLKANTAFPGLIIRYTTDRTEPTANSPVYNSPISYVQNIKLKAFNIIGRGSRTLTIP